MGEKFRDIYRIGSSRLQNWNYGWNGLYYITICTAGRECCLGDILDGQIVLSDIGKIANTEWLKSPEIRPDINLILDEYQIMPNHIHGIIQIGRNRYNIFQDRDLIDNHGRRGAMPGVSSMPVVSSTQGTPKTDQAPGSIERSNDKGITKLEPQRKNISSIVKGFKSSVTTKASEIKSDFGWQPRFYDVLIRDQESLYRIRRYIRNNPKHWEEYEYNI